MKKTKIKCRICGRELSQGRNEETEPFLFLWPPPNAAGNQCWWEEVEEDNQD